MTISTRRNRRPSRGFISLTLASIATTALLGVTISTSHSSDTTERCFSTPDAAEAWISHGATMPDCARP